MTVSTFNGDCLDIMPTIPDGSVDMILTDLSYGTTNNGWDSVVLDPFMGSGTTAIACMRTGRRFVGFEIDQGYWETCIERIGTEGRAA